MMYQMKKIVNHNEAIQLPKCMYTVKTINNTGDSSNHGEIDINIGQQVIKFLKGHNTGMAELESRQNQLLKKLDSLYERIQNISSICKIPTKVLQSPNTKSQKAISTPDEIVLVMSPDNLPWFMNIIGTKISDVNVSWHIHSSVPNEKVIKIKAFTQKLPINGNSKTTLRLIFKNADSELKLSSLDVPIVGTVNILRYLSLVYPTIVPYDETYTADSLLDVCHLLERASEKNKEALIKKLFSLYDGWLYQKSFSIVDIAAYNVVKQWRSCPKSVPKEWLDRCEKV